jgi:RND family efflux transporter MFP subunit
LNSPLPLVGRGTSIAALLLAGVVSAQSAGRPAPIVAVAEVTQEEILEGRSFVGTVKPTRIASIGSAVDGRLIEVLVKEGQRVTFKQPIAKIGAEQIELQLAVNAALVRQRKAELGELTAGSRAGEKRRAKAKHDGAKARLAFAKQRFDRETNLVKARATTDEALEEARQLLDVAENALREAAAELDLVEEGPRKEQILQAQAKLDSEVEEGRRLEDQLMKHTIFAWFDGYVTLKQAEVGTWIKRGDSVLEIAALDEVDVEANVLEGDTANLAVGAPVRVGFDALPGRIFTGKVDTIIPAANVRARTFPVKIRLANTTQGGTVLIKSGMLASAMLPVGRKQPALLVPKDALVLGGPQPLLYAVDPIADKPGTGTVRAVPVQLGVVRDLEVQVIGALTPGTRVVTLGNERLRPGIEVRVGAPSPKPATTAAEPDAGADSAGSTPPPTPDRGSAKPSAGAGGP